MAKWNKMHTLTAQRHTLYIIYRSDMASHTNIYSAWYVICVLCHEVA